MCTVYCISTMGSLQEASFFVGFLGTCLYNRFHYSRSGTPRNSPMNYSFVSVCVCKTDMCTRSSARRFGALISYQNYKILFSATVLMLFHVCENPMRERQVHIFSSLKLT